MADIVNADEYFGNNTVNASDYFGESSAPKKSFNDVLASARKQLSGMPTPLGTMQDAGQPISPPTARGVLQGAGLIGGGMIGGPLAPLTAGLGYAAVNQGLNAYDQLTGNAKPTGMQEALAQALKDTGYGAMADVSGRLMGLGTEKMLTPSPLSVPKEVAYGMEKGVRPSVAGKQGMADYTKYMKNSETAVNAILDNKDNITLTDANGNPTQGPPKNLKQFSEAIDQTKKAIFQKYDTMNKAAGMAGIEVDLNPVADELNQIAASNVVNKLSPNVAKQAASMAQRFQNQTFTASEAQDAIQHLNDQLDAYYKHPSPEMTRKAALDALVANNLRKGLDDSIMSISGPDAIRYQSLKNTYGALRSIEKDVINRTIVDARKNVAGLVDFSNMYSAAHYMRGILAADPASIGSAVAVQGVKKYVKYLNDPNPKIANMFKNVEEARGGTTPSSLPDMASLATKAGFIALRPSGENNEQ